MTEYGFAVAVSKKELRDNPEDAMQSVKRVLRFNYNQFVEYVTEQGGDTSFTDLPPRLVQGPDEPLLPNHDPDETHFAWYVNTEEPREDLPILEAIDG